MKIFTVCDGTVTPGAAIGRRKVGTVEISTVSVGEEGRGRKLASLPVEDGAVHPDEAGIVPGLVREAAVGVTRSGTPKLLKPTGPDDGGECLVVLMTGIGFRGGNAHTGDRTGRRLCAESGPCRGEPFPDGSPCPQCGAAGEMEFLPFPGRILATGRVAQGDAGGMGDGDQLIAVVPKGVVFRTYRSGRLYGAPSSHYFCFDGEQVIAVTWGERVAADLWF